ncbi:MAG: hypothetical protein ACI4EF_09970, partial [Coprococcus sp.]
MIAEILFFATVLMYLVFGKKRGGSVSESLRDPLYMAWFLMSLSVFNYTPSVLQYIIRAGTISFSLIAIKVRTNK